MGVFTYTAINRGKLTAGHTANTVYQIEIPLSQWAPSIDEHKNSVRSLSGKPFIVLHHQLDVFSFSTVGTEDPSLIAQLEELFSSVAAGETFSIDPYGTIASPDNPVTVIIDGPARPTRLTQTEFAYSGRVERV